MIVMMSLVVGVSVSVHVSAVISVCLERTCKRVGVVMIDASHIDFWVETCKHINTFVFATAVTVFTALIIIMTIIMTIIITATTATTTITTIITIITSAVCWKTTGRTGLVLQTNHRILWIASITSILIITITDAILTTHTLVCIMTSLLLRGTLLVIAGKSCSDVIMIIITSLSMLAHLNRLSFSLIV